MRDIAERIHIYTISVAELQKLDAVRRCCHGAAASVSGFSSDRPATNTTRGNGFRTEGSSADGRGSAHLKFEVSASPVNEPQPRTGGHRRVSAQNAPTTIEQTSRARPGVRACDATEPLSIAPRTGFATGPRHGVVAHNATFSRH